MSVRKWTPSFGHIIRTSVPHTDTNKKSDRYPVVVSGSGYNNNYKDVIVAFTTSSTNIRHPLDYDVEISDKHPEFSQTGLKHSTTIRCGRLHTIKQDLISDCIGCVPENLLIDIEKLVLKNFK